MTITVNTPFTVSGIGQDALTDGFHEIQTVSIKLTTLSPLVKVLDDDDHLLRAGWWSYGLFGADFGNGLDEALYWAPPFFINFTNSFWQQVLSVTQDQTIVGIDVWQVEMIRWHLTPGVEGTMTVYSL